MNTHNRFTLTILLFLSGVGITIAAPAMNIPEFTARYKVEKSGFDAIRMQLSLQKADELWKITSESEPTGIVSLFAGDQQVTEQSTFDIDADNSLIPQEYRYTHRGSDKNRNQHYIFDWKNNQAIIDYRGNKSILPLEKGTLDSFSAQFALMRDAAGDSDKLSYFVISKGRGKTYDYIKLENETLDTDLGALKTIKLQRRKGSEEDYTLYTSWHAPKLHYLPVKVMKEENGKIELAMRLHKVEWQNDNK